MGDAAHYEKCIRNIIGLHFQYYMDALLAEHRAEVSTTRDAALEEAKARIIKRCCAKMAEHRFCEHQPCDYYQNALTEIRALKSSPAERYLPETKVREVLTRRRGVAQRAMTAAMDQNEGSTYHSSGGRMTECENIAGDLGVDLDAKGEPSGPLGCCGLYGTPHDACVHAKPAARQMCTCLGSCRGASGLGEGWKCALGEGKS